MVVVDASVMADWLIRGGALGLAEPPVEGDREGLAAPHLLDAEVGHALRGQVLCGNMSSERAREGLHVLLRVPIERYGHRRLLPRAFELRDNATFYDALYLALAEALEATLWTRDAALAKVPGVAAKVEVLA